MAVGKPYSIGSSWPGDVLRRLLGVRGKWEPPGSLQDQLAAVVEVRPHFPFEYYRAGWVRGALQADSPAVAGQNSHVALGNPASSGRAVLVYPPSIPVSSFVGTYTGAVFGGAPGNSSCVTDGRWVANNASLLAQLAALIATGAAAALPAVGTRVWLRSNVDRSDPVWVLMPGEALFYWVTNAQNTALSIAIEVLEIPLEDLN